MFLPITERCREFPAVTDWQIDAYFGQIGDKSGHATQLAYSLERESDGLTSVLRALVETGGVTRGTKIAVQTDFASSEEPLFWFAGGAAHLLNARLRARRPDLFNETSKNDAELVAQLEMVFGPLLARNATTTTFNFGPGVQVFPSLSV